MRVAHQVWIGVFVVTFVVLTAAQYASERELGTSAAAAAPSTAATDNAPSTTTPSELSPAVVPTPAAEGVTVTRVVDGDTIVVDGNRRIRILGIDACEMSTPGGERAQGYLQSAVDNPLNSPITLTREPGVDRDRYGRELRYVQLAGTDLGGFMIPYPEVGVYAGRNDASASYVASLRSQDDGPRDCAGLPEAPVSSSDVDVDLDHHDRNHRDGSATLGFCQHKWWC